MYTMIREQVCMKEKKAPPQVKRKRKAHTCCEQSNEKKTTSAETKNSIVVWRMKVKQRSNEWKKNEHDHNIRN